MNLNDRRIGLVGCGHRGIVGFLASLKEIGRAGNVVALCDLNPVRLNFAHEFLGQADCARYGDFSEFLRHPGLDTVIVSTPDHSHRDLVVAAFAAGKHVVCEKPMATTLPDCQAMISAQNGLDLRVAFNLRYNAVSRKIREIIDTGALGRILHVEARDIVSFQHGSDYFRRWHRLMAKSGGLLVHKSTHTFDVINWWVGDVPERVFARASKSFYLPSQQRSTRCLGCAAAKQCRFHVDLTQDVPGQHSGIDNFYKRMYIDGEPHDGYIRDTCVFNAENDIYDTHHVNVRYAGGALFTYTGVFYAPYEDRRIALQGDRGRMDISIKDRNLAISYGPDAKTTEHVHVPVETGGHGGADVNLMRSLFCNADTNGQQATAANGYYSVAIADGANISIRTGADVAIAKLAV